MNTNHKNIEELVEYHFEIVKKPFKAGKTGEESVAGVLELKGEKLLKEDRNSKDRRASLAKFYLKLKKKYAFKMDYPEDFIQVFSMLFVEACYQLDKLEALDELLADDILYNTRMKYIRDHIERYVIVEVNPHAKRVMIGTDDNNKAIVKTIEIEYASVNSLVQNEEGHKSELVDSLNEENQLFKSGRQATYNHFLQYFLENKEDVLTQKQLDKYDSLKNIYTPLYDNSNQSRAEKAEMYEQADISKSDFNKFKNNVKRRVTKKYEEEFGTNNKCGFNTKNRETTRSIFEEYIRLADDTEWTSANERQVAMSRYVTQYYDSREEFEVVITANLSLDEKKEVVRAVKGKDLLSHRVIRLIKSNIVEHLEAFKDMEITPAKQIWEGYTESTYAGLKDSNAKAFNLNTHGELIAKESEDKKLMREQKAKYMEDSKGSECKTYCLLCYQEKGELNLKVDKVCTVCNRSVKNGIIQEM
ncbi:hypothetical protein [Macrococcus carouselicus]|uniref:Uncharacterized protein n=1 Tax=Macrococcus carouselicus TaxID=69969 RepID=A0A9Q8FRG6_9STAP|nr:hypothetical protein [Macrococcus carouselicus]TDM04054.1 hypothetical protein ERX40_02475 [Macrococcus carouselicus]